MEALGNTGYISDKDVRMFLHDTPDGNLLLDDYEFTPEDIRTAQTLIVDKWNETPPNVAQYNLYNFPYRYHLLLGVAAHLYWMAAAQYRRNNLQYQIGGGAINDQAKAPEYQAIGDQLMQRFEAWMVNKKNELQNLSGWAAV